MRKTNPNLGRMGYMVKQCWGILLRKTKPFPAEPGGTGLGGRGENMRNEPNSGERTGRGPITRNKANWPPAAYPTIPLFHHSCTPVPRLLCETNQIVTVTMEIQVLYGK